VFGLVTTVSSCACRLRRRGIGASSRAVHHAAKGRSAHGPSTAGNFTGIFSTQASEHNHTIFDPDIELLNGLASRCTTELKPAWLMSTLLLRYLPLVALRLLWRRAGLVSHADALPHRGRCHCFLRDLFDSGQHWSLAAATVLVLLIPLDIVIGPLFNAARATRVSTRPARQTAAAVMARAATVPFWITSPALPGQRPVQRELRRCAVDCRRARHACRVTSSLRPSCRCWGGEGCKGARGGGCTGARMVRAPGR